METYEHVFHWPTWRVNDGEVNVGIIALSISMLQCRACGTKFQTKKPIPPRLCPAFLFRCRTMKLP